MNVCFWYVPASLRHAEAPDLPSYVKEDSNIDTDRDAANWLTRLDAVAPILKGRMMRAGSLMVSYQPMGRLPNFWRIVFSNPATRLQDCDWILHEMHRLGHDIRPQTEGHS